MGNNSFNHLPLDHFCDGSLYWRTGIENNAYRWKEQLKETAQGQDWFFCVDLQQFSRA